MKCKLKEIMDKRMIKQKALAERIGVAPQTLSAIVRGKQEPTLRVAMRIAKVLELPIEEIWQEEEEKQE
ncbi:helix-turn-helix transcriptional regulator [Bacillus sp. OTU530]|uniref:helix-turn-helix transcriptional regulator n=1 Tax=Bacillus sp. OTU530 TaxID=3043862 RepID=UPI00313ADAC6